MVGKDYHTKHFPRIPRHSDPPSDMWWFIVVACLLLIAMSVAGREDYKAALDADSFRIAAERQHEINKKQQIEEMVRRANGN